MGVGRKIGGPTDEISCSEKVELVKGKPCSNGNSFSLKVTCRDM